MAYSINPNLPRARAFALKLLIVEKRPLSVVANRCGVHRSTVWRWKRKWFELNKNVQFDNPNRPSRIFSFKNKLHACKWLISTTSSRPHTCSHAISEEIVRRVMELRHTLKRCAEVVWHHLRVEDGIQVSLSSVRRILKRNHAFDGARKNRVRPDNPRRPQPTYPGELVQTDTIHYICPQTYQRRYVYTVIDLYSRIAYVEIHDHIRPGIAADVIMRAQSYGSFRFSMVQADNGPEYSRYFEQRLRVLVYRFDTVGLGDQMTMLTLNGSTELSKKNASETGSAAMWTAPPCKLRLTNILSSTTPNEYT